MSREIKKAGIVIVAVVFMIAGILYQINFKGTSDSIITLQQEEVEHNIMPNETDSKEANKSSTEHQRSENLIYVHVCGAVKKPGVYPVEKDARVSDAVKAAKGFTKKAAKDVLNLAQCVTDGEKIYIPTLDETKKESKSELLESDAEASKASDNSNKININLAGKEELMTLAGIGEAKADSILEYRKEHGSFQTIEELKNIRGIKDGIFHKIKEKITV